MRLKKERAILSDTENTSLKLLNKHSSSKRSTRTTRRSPIRNYPNISTGGTSTAMTLPEESETKRHVDLATLSPLLRLSKPEWRSSTEKILLRCRLSFCWLATTWLRVVREVGHTSTPTSRKTHIWLLRSALLTRLLPRELPVASTRTANLRLRSARYTMLVVLTVKLPKSSWWKRSFAMVHWILSFKLQTSSAPTSQDSLLPMASKHCKSCLPTRRRARKQVIFPTKHSTTKVTRGKTWTIQCSFLGGEKTSPTEPDTGLLETATAPTGERRETSSSGEAKTTWALKANRLPSTCRNSEVNPADPIKTNI